jgi:SagB-type dehydrogenase family enzyme
MTKWIYIIIAISLLLLFSGCRADSVTKSVSASAPTTSQQTGSKTSQLSEPDSVSNPSQATTTQIHNSVIKLPEPRYDSEVSLEQSLLKRRSIRDYTNDPLTLSEVSQLLWAAQGITDDKGHRTAPSSGTLYPIQLYLVAGNVESLAPGIYTYQPETHEITLYATGDIRDKLSDAASGQSCVRKCAFAIVFTVVYEPMIAKYGDHGTRYVILEAGHAAQNLCLQVAALNLGTVTVGGFNDDKVSSVLNLPDDENPLYILPVGKKQ